MTVSKEKVDIILAKKQTTISALCENEGISRARFYAILNSKNVTPKSVGRIAGALGVSVEEII